MFRQWAAQRRPLRLNKEASKAFLEDSVDVHKQTRVECKQGVAKVVSSPLFPMTRIAFMRLWVVWFAMAISAGAVAIYAPNNINPSDLAVQQAITYLQDNYPNVEKFNNAYFDRVFDTKTSSAHLDLGYYARSTSMSGGFSVSCREP